MSSLALLAPQQAHANSDEACETLMCMSGLVGNGSPKKPVTSLLIDTFQSFDLRFGAIPAI